ncbi:MAG: methyltransferase domain-containing protein [candidate division WOR-3 bacterium]
MEEKKQLVYDDEELTYLRAWNVSVIQRKSGYRFAVDSLLLAALSNIPKRGKLIDLGSGSGVLSFIVATRSPGIEVIGVELQDKLLSMAERGAILNGLADRVKFVKADLKDLKSIFAPGSFDYAISNPPYWHSKFARTINDEETLLARYEVATNMEEVVSVASYLLKNRGRLAVIYPAKRAVSLLATMRRERLEPKRMIIVHAYIDRKAEFVFVEALKGGKEGLDIEPPLIIYSKKNLYREDFAKLVGIRDELVDKGS